MDTLKNRIVEAIRKHINQRSGIDWRNYGGSRQAYMSDYLPMLKHGKQSRELLAFVEDRDSITAEILLEASRRAFSGRLSISVDGDDVKVDYCTGQYFVTEYRLAVCAVLGEAVRLAYCDETFKTRQEWETYARKHFGRTLSRWM